MQGRESLCRGRTCGGAAGALEGAQHGRDGAGRADVLRVLHRAVQAGREGQACRVQGCEALQPRERHGLRMHVT